MIRVGLDTNVLAYLAGVNRGQGDADKIVSARALLSRLEGRAQLVAPTQTLGELFGVLLKSGAPREDARIIVLRLLAGFDGANTGAATLKSALDLAVDHRLQLWDALIISAAAEAGCSLLLSEDMQDGFVWRGLTTANPFASRPHDRLSALMN
ncbi:MAG: PIN domain-containing protein [Caulobacteraceae bacterium]